MAIALHVKPLKVTTNLRKMVMHFRDTRLYNLKSNSVYPNLP